LFTTRTGNTLESPSLLSTAEVNERLWDLGAEIFLPCAASRLVSLDQIDRLVRGGTEVIACGANVPFSDEQMFYGPIAGRADEQLSVIPDFIANCGMARVFAYLMGSGEVELSDESIFADTSAVIRDALRQVHNKCPEKRFLTRTAFEIALSKLI